ncbi:hypothetical protein CTAYLR_007435 [Chrysophaeum taylorii]|uniref:Eukaryotic translation initiation factor 3 subunit L n=1 Tax=Chrysophaeum taylorii TaxID=2483200 RepID=A0AAD7UB05_9STRA|nr:hypothetical protein CTAYLR_007435 [Chrysophaeum taylorii]
MDSDSFLVNSQMKDFCFDLHDATRRSHIVEDIKRLYDVELRELSDKYCDKQPWPQAEAIAPQCLGLDGRPDEFFLTIYTEMAYRHLFAKLKPSLEDRLRAWENYCALFDGLLRAGDVETTLTPQWIFDILHEFVYQFQSFCQYRTMPRTIDERQVLEANRSAWSVSAVYSYLHGIVAVSKIGGGQAPSVLHAHAGYFAVAVASRLDCLLCDYEGAVRVLDRIPGLDNDLFAEVFACRLHVYYHLGFALLMLRKYVEAARVLDAIVAQLARIHKAGGGNFARGGLPPNAPPAEQVQKIFDRILALLTVTVGLAPSGAYRVDDISTQYMKDKHADKLAQMDRGDASVFETLLTSACPKVVVPAVPDYPNLDPVLTAEGLAAAAAQTPTTAKPANPKGASHDAYDLQIRLFTQEVDRQCTLSKIRSYLKLYTSIEVDKLARFNDVHDAADFRALLAGLKHKIPADTTVHFYVDKDMIYVDEPTSSYGDQPPENFFMDHIHKYDVNIQALLDGSPIPKKERDHHQHRNHHHHQQQHHHGPQDIIPSLAY